MSARRAKQDLKAGVQQLENMWESLAEKHLNQNQGRSKLSLVLGTIPHLLILAFTIFVVWTAKPSSSLFSWHPTLMTLAFMLLMSEAILMFSPWSSLAFNGKWADKTLWHWVLQACAVTAAYTGLAIITCNKYLNGSPHYTSWHGSIGIFQCGVIAIQISGGILEQFPDILPFKVRLVYLKRLHAFFGVLTYFGGLTTLVLGLYSSWFMANVDGLLWKACCGCPVVLAVVVLIQVARSQFSWIWRWQ